MCVSIIERVPPNCVWGGRTALVASHRDAVATGLTRVALRYQGNLTVASIARSPTRVCVAAVPIHSWAGHLRTRDPTHRLYPLSLLPAGHVAHHLSVMALARGPHPCTCSAVQSDAPVSAWSCEVLTRGRRALKSCAALGDGWRRRCRGKRM